MEKKPNILWICTDQQRYDTLGCYGNGFVSSPNIDRLASEGIIFDRAYSQSPVCTPARSCFLTGRYPRTNRCRQNGQKIPEDELLVSKIFHDNGYNCGLSGKLHIAPCHWSVCKTTEERIDDGYSVFNWSHHPQDFNRPGGGWSNNEYHNWLRSQGKSYETHRVPGSTRVDYGMPEELHQTKWCVDRAIDFIRANEAHDQPWFHSLNIYDPHHPFDPPKEYLDRYMDRLDEIPLPNYVEGELENKNVFQNSEHVNGAYNGDRNFIYDIIPEREHKLLRASYWAMCDVIDHQVGRLMDTLDELGCRENTIVIFTSDHGEMLGDHGIYLKGPHFYDICVKIPYIMSWKGHILEGKRSNALIEHTDLAPTIMDLAGIEPYEGMQGMSYKDLLFGDSDIDHFRDDVMAEYSNAMPGHKHPKAFLTMLRDERYKLVCDHSGGICELYDMYEDPNETHNIFERPDMADVRFRMMKRLCDRIAFTVDPLPRRLAGF